MSERDPDESARLVLGADGKCGSLYIFRARKEAEPYRPPYRMVVDWSEAEHVPVLLICDSPRGDGREVQTVAELAQWLKIRILERSR